MCVVAGQSLNVNSPFHLIRNRIVKLTGKLWRVTSNKKSFSKARHSWSGKFLISYESRIQSVQVKGTYFQMTILGSFATDFPVHLCKFM